MKWNDIDKGYPDQNLPVLIYYEDMAHGNASVAYHIDHRFYNFHTDTSSMPIRKPTHWMPLPEFTKFKPTKRRDNESK